MEFFLTSIIDKVEPNNINKAWNHSDLQERKKWRSFIQYELTTMVDKNVLNPIESSKESLIKRPLRMK